MHVTSHRTIVIISGLLTLVVLVAGSLGIALHNGWLVVASDAVGAVNPADTREVAARDGGATPASPGAATQAWAPSSSQGALPDDVAVYRAKLEEAYQALDQAYAQIRSLQAAQAQPSARTIGGREFGDREEAQERGERGHRERDRDDD